MSAVISRPAGSTAKTGPQKFVAPEETGASGAPAVTIDIESLILGRELSFPIHDAKGVLLLAGGVTITPEFKRRLIARGLTTVVVHTDDVAHTTLNATLLEHTPATFKVDQELAAKLDSIINAAPMTVVNTGPSHRTSMVVKGRSAYDPTMKDELLSQHRSASASLDEMFNKILQGGDLSTDQVTGIVSSYLTSMTADVDHVLSVTISEVSQDHALADHALKMALLSMAIGIEMGLDAENVRKIGLCGLVQDWGMTRVPKQIREATGVLTPVEVYEIQKHPIYVLKILDKISWMPKLVQVVAYQVHERPDGSGYPRGRSGKTIHQFARILHVADAYTAMTASRPGRRPMIPYSAIECLIRQAQKNRVDPAVVRCLLQILSLFPIGSFLTLSDASIAKVLRRNGNDYAHPIVLCIQDKHGNPADPFDDASLIDLSKSELTIVQALPTPGRDEVGLSPEIVARGR